MARHRASQPQRTVTDCCQRHDPKAGNGFAQGLLYIALNLVDDYDETIALALLAKNAEQLLRGFWDPNSPFWLSSGLGEDFQTSPQIQPRLQMHIISLFRCLCEMFGVRKDIRQHEIDQSYTADFNVRIYGSVVGTNGSRRFGIFDSQSMLSALGKSPLFQDGTSQQLAVEAWGNKMMAQLRIGYPSGFLVCHSI